MTLQPVAVDRLHGGLAFTQPADQPGAEGEADEQPGEHRRAGAERKILDDVEEVDRV